MLHVEDLWIAFQTFQSVQRRSMNSYREPAKAKEIMVNGQNAFEAFCKQHNLPIDFTPREQS